MGSLSCVIIDDEFASIEVLTLYISKNPRLKLLKSFHHPTEAILFTQTNKVDLFFIDIIMPEFTGLTLAKIFGKEANIIIVTGHRDYACECFNLNVIDYLLKPVSFDRFLQAVQKLKPPTKSLQINHFMFVKADRKMVKIDFSAIFYIESLSDYVKIITNQKTILTRETISNLEQKLLSNNFIRIHRSFIVSLNKINSYTNEFVEINKKTIPISRSYKERVLHKLAQI